MTDDKTTKQLTTYGKAIANASARRAKLIADMEADKHVSLARAKIQAAQAQLEASEEPWKLKLAGSACCTGAAAQRGMAGGEAP